MNEEIKKYIDEEVEKFKQELIDRVEEKTAYNSGYWRPKHNEIYYYLNASGYVDHSRWNDELVYDVDSLLIGNVFKTREDAKFEVERRKIEAVMKRYSSPFEYNKKNYHIYIDNNAYLSINCSHYHNYGAYYFETREIAEQVIDEIGGERLKKYWFRLEN